MSILYKYKDICNIDKKFYDLFEGKKGIETEKTYKLKKELQKYVIHQLYSHDTAYNNCELTFRDWCFKYGYISEKLEALDNKDNTNLPTKQNDIMEIIIDNETYVCKKANIDLNKFNEDGISKIYEDISYVIIQGNDIRVRILKIIYDENNKRNAFDPLNYSEDIKINLAYGDECYLENLYEIISTTNKSGKIYYDYLEKEYIHKDLINKCNIQTSLEI